MNVAFMGTGIMGSHMAANLMTDRFDLVVHNRTRSRAESLIEQGATWAETPADAAQEADVVITMLAHPEAVEATALADKTGFLDAMKPGSIWVDCSTTNPVFARRMAEAASVRNVRYLDAPVAGSKDQAQAAVLVFFVGGAADDVQTCQPLFDAMGKHVNHVGEAGMGNALKLVINHMLAISMIAFAEGLVPGESLGLSQEKLLDTLIGGPVTPPYLAGKRTRLESMDFEVAFPLRWMQKDLRMVGEMAAHTQTAMPVASAARETYQFAVQQGYGDSDFSAIYAFLRERA